MTEPVSLHDAEQTLEAAQPKRYEAYPAYRPSAIDWLGYLPEHWDVRRLKFIATTIMGQSPSSDDYTVDEDALPFLQGNAEFGPVSPSPRYYCDAATKRAPTGSLLISVRAPVGAVNIADQPYGIGRGLCAVVPDSRLLLPSFTWYALPVTRNELWSIATGSTYEAVSANEMAAMSMPLPPVDEQQAIARFLDDETKKIEDLIEAKRDLLALLKEKRQAVISHAVTKGLNPDARLKPSGVDWLGDVPEHWDVKRLKFLSRVNPSPSELAGIRDEEDVSFVPMDAVYEYGGLRLDTVRPLEEVKSGFTYFRDGDVVVAKITPCFENGKGSMAVGLTNGLAFGTTELHVVRSSPLLDRTFLFYLTISDVFRKLGAAEMYGAGGQKRVPTDFVRDFPVAFPDIDEQQAIACFLDEQTKKIEEITQETIAAIDRLTEYRTALISAVVTGKIDVRGGAT